MNNNDVGVMSSTVSDVQSDLYVMESETFDDLCRELIKPCPCSGKWILSDKRRVNLTYCSMMGCMYVMYSLAAPTIGCN